MLVLFRQLHVYVRLTILVDSLNAAASNSNAFSVNNCGHLVKISFLYLHNVSYDHDYQLLYGYKIS